jgi:hypothetical protein
MECGVCGKPSKQRAKVFIKGDPLRVSSSEASELYLCPKCVLRLQKQRLEYCEERQRYRFDGIRRRNGLLRGRILRDNRLPKGKAATGLQGVRAKLDN